eukprot:CAMPEP_0176289256 /NCGR_PEP_ID=MMETSP0121_2-20121125/54403_1 /TAXON_ID=160619 /ORGANISM="Kryptoperidinium foliaceum, Strain CCMP 1326" /LENGTH=60 /DNA_ID=CAMNT_0017629989 /DNA_START=120 /DNA_END=299 /DNA_ORIENTATION=+
MARGKGAHRAASSRSRKEARTAEARRPRRGAAAPLPALTPSPALTPQGVFRASAPVGAAW